MRVVGDTYSPHGMVLVLCPLAMQCSLRPQTRPLNLSSRPVTPWTRLCLRPLRTTEVPNPCLVWARPAKGRPHFVFKHALMLPSPCRGSGGPALLPRKSCRSAAPANASVWTCGAGLTGQAFWLSVLLMQGLGVSPEP